MWPNEVENELREKREQLANKPPVRVEPMFRQIASTVQAIANCREAGNQEWLARHEETLSQLENFLPSGSGIDCGTKIDRDASNGEKIILNTSFHHMNDNGMYDGWTEHTITVRASLVHTIDIRIGGRNRNEIKEYLHEVYYHALTSVVWFDPTLERWYSSQFQPAPA